MFKIGLNPYGIAYSVGLAAAGTPRANPKPLGLNGFLDLADIIRASGVELPIALLKDVPELETDRVRERLHAQDRYAILMHGISWGDVDSALVYAKRFGFKTIRMHLTSVLCGARGALGENGGAWRRLYDDSRRQFIDFAHKAADENLTVTLEDHQDLTSDELLEICQASGSNVGICLDTGNPLAVAEDPLEFAAKVAPCVKHVHLKDYKIHWGGDGYRLKRCAIGSGAVPFVDLARILRPYGVLPASIEPGALGERFVKFYTEEWWQGFPELDSKKFNQFLSDTSASFQPSHADWRTPWDTNATPDELCKYEMDELMQSVLNLQDLGLWPQSAP